MIPLYINKHHHFTSFFRTRGQASRPHRKPISSNSSTADARATSGTFAFAALAGAATAGPGDVLEVNYSKGMNYSDDLWRWFIYWCEFNVVNVFDDWTMLMIQMMNRNWWIWKWFCDDFWWFTYSKWWGSIAITKEKSCLRKPANSWDASKDILSFMNQLGRLGFVISCDGKKIKWLGNNPKLNGKISLILKLI